LPPQNIKIEVGNKAPFFFLDEDTVEVSYCYDHGGDKLTLPSDTIIHYNDNRVDYKENDFLKGTSKLHSLKEPIRNIKAAYATRGKMLLSRGALGILSNATKDATGGTMPLDDDERERLQEEYKKYGVQPDQFDIIITNMALEWQQMGVDIDKLRVFEEVREDFFKIMDAYGTPQDLFADAAGTTFENQKQAEKRFYESTIIPESSEWIGGINQYLGTEQYEWELQMDYSHLPVFQENKSEKADAVNKAVKALDIAYQSGIITREEYKAELQNFGIAV
jgi:hypothetical protein